MRVNLSAVVEIGLRLRTRPSAGLFAGQREDGLPTNKAGGLLKTVTAVVVVALVAPATAAALAHTVRGGETLISIAASHGTTVAVLARLNRLDPSKFVLAGAVLRIPRTGGSSTGIYIVEEGDTLSALARHFKTTVRALATANGLDPADVLLVGRHLRVVRRHSEPVAALPHLEGRYRVRSGDTLTGIARQYGASVAALARANERSTDDRLLVNEILRVPKRRAPGVSPYLPYTVRPGDTLTAIAIRFGMGLDELARVNVLDPAHILLAGTALRVRAALQGPPSTHPGVLAAIDRWAGAYHLDRSLVRGLAWMESGYRAELVSAAGAVGVMQVLPTTWSFVETVLLGERVPQTIDGNVHVGVAYLDHLLTLFGGDERLALAAYYQGPASVRTGGVLHESQDYVDDILALRERM